MAHMKILQAYVRAYPIDLAKLDRQIRVASTAIAEAMRRDFEQCVTSWNTKPSFTIWGPAIRGGHITTRVGPRAGEGARIWQFVDEGTEGAGVLRRPGGGAFPIRSYGAKTSPGRLRSSPGGYRGAIAFRRSTTHVGIEARNFTQTIVAKYNTGKAGGVREIVRQSLNTVFQVAPGKPRLVSRV